MNFSRGLFRLWVAAVLVWVVGASWVMRVDLTGGCDY
jgi:hypothetical protein